MRVQQRCSSCFVIARQSSSRAIPLHLCWYTIEVWDLALLRRWLNITNNMANARKTRIYNGQNWHEKYITDFHIPYCVGCTLSLFWGCTFHVWTQVILTQPQPTTAPLHKGSRPTRSWVAMCAPPLRAALFFPRSPSRGHPLYYSQGGSFPLDGKFTL